MGGLWANVFYEETGSGDVVLRAMPLLLVVLCVLAIAYRYYSAFLAAKVAALDDSRPTPAHTLNDGQNYHPTNKWVLFGHHFAAISGAGPLIGPVLAIQYGYMPGLLWLVIGVCLAGAVQDMLVLAASVRRGGKSLAQIAFTELGRGPALIVSLAILVIVVIALAGLGFVVVKALGGEEVKFAKDTEISLPPKQRPKLDPARTTAAQPVLRFPEGCRIHYVKGQPPVVRPESFLVILPTSDPFLKFQNGEDEEEVPPAIYLEQQDRRFPDTLGLPTGAALLVPGSSWGTFTIACTIPIALFVGLWMYKIRKGRVVEASLIGAVGVLAATIAGNWIPGSPLEGLFALDRTETVLALCAYGFVASVLPVWLLLCPRDYISSFLKIGTIALLVLGVIAANPALPCPAVNTTFIDGGPTFAGSIFPFVFICIMCGAISGFHSLVSSGTTPKMVNKESDIRPIGYGSMLIEGLVGVVALIAAASLPVDLYYDINVGLDKASDPALQAKLRSLYQEQGIERAARDPLLRAGGNVPHLNVQTADLAEMEKLVGGESLRGRTGGAVTLAVGMSRILTDAMQRINLYFEDIVKYWYHFAIMFEALFILTTIDTGTRIARFLMQETVGKVYPKFERTDWLPGAMIATFVVTAGWGLLVATGSIDTIWPMFGIANQLLAVLALCLVTTLLVNSGRGRYAPVTLLPMLFVTATTMTAGVQMSGRFWEMMTTQGEGLRGALNLTLTLFVMVSVASVLLIAVSRWLLVMRGLVPIHAEEAPSEGESAPPDAIEERPRGR
ncbi:MAG: carbon starvation protein A [Gemmataceae bacterium]|nr:carbon starvation protein A [Gemmataceae bacterium]